MNYIKQLQYEGNRRAAEICGLRASITDLIAYLQSPKFHEDNTVNVNDVMLRLREGEDRTQKLIDETPVPD